jgi:uncharacterized Tic20 family protein
MTVARIPPATSDSRSAKKSGLRMSMVAKWVLFLLMVPSLIGGLLMLVVWLLLPGSSPLDDKQATEVPPPDKDSV